MSSASRNVSSARTSPGCPTGWPMHPIVSISHDLEGTNQDSQRASGVYFGVNQQGNVSSASAGPTAASTMSASMARWVRRFFNLMWDSLLQSEFLLNVVAAEPSRLALMTHTAAAITSNAQKGSTRVHHLPLDRSAISATSGIVGPGPREAARSFGSCSLPSTIDARRT